MLRPGTVNYHGLDGSTTVEHQMAPVEDGEFHWLRIGGYASFFVEGHGPEALANLLAFLDRMHAIRNALLGDVAQQQLPLEPVNG